MTTSTSEGGYGQTPSDFTRRMEDGLRVLLVEDSDADAVRIEGELRQQGFKAELKRVMTREGVVEALREFRPDLVLADYVLPQFDGMAAIDLVRAEAPGVPVIVVTGSIDEETAVECMKAGAADYVLKEHLAKLGQSVRSALERRRMVQARLGAELALRESEERYRLMVEGSHEIFFYRHGPAHELEYLSPSVGQVLGYAPEELVGKKYDVLLTGDPSDAEVHRLTEEAMRYGVRGTSYLAVVRHKDGRRRVIEITESPVLRRGRAVAMQGFARDVTERRLAEERLQEQARLLDLAPDAVMAFDMQDRIQFWSEGAERLTGYRRTEADGRWAPDLDYWGLGAYETGRQITLEKGEWEAEAVRFTRDKRKITVATRWRLARTAGGEPRLMLVLESDITDRKRVEQQLLQAQRMHSMGTLAGGIAHDLNNILSPVLMAAQVLRTEFTDDYVRTMLDTIEGCAKRGADVVKQLLTFARGIQGERVSVQMRHLAKEIVAMAQETFPKSIKVTSFVPRELWPVMGDATQLHQVVLNLSVNARDAMPDGGTLQVSGENVVLDETFVSMAPDSKPGPYVLITVSDTGPGIPPEMQDQIFEPFFTTKQTGRNPGLGLSTVLGIVRSHGGFVKVTSQVGKGAAFKVFLPATPGALVNGGEVQAQLPRGNGELILLADDESGIRDSAAAMLRKYGYEVVTAGDGAEALALYAQRSAAVRLVIADIVMPLMDGLAFVHGLRKIAPQVAVIAASGLMDDPDQAGKISELRALRVHRFLTKPFTAEDLLTAINAELTGTPPTSEG